MKKTLVITALAAGVASGYSQGTVNFFDRQADVTIHIYAPQVASPGVETTGNANSAVGVTADIYDNNGVDANIGNAGLNTGGTTVYTGGAIGNTAAANPTAAGLYNYNNGSDYTVELYAAPGINANVTALVPVSQYVSTIYTSATLGGAFKSVTVNSDPGMPFSGANATIALVAWYNGGVSPTGLSQAALTAQYAGSPVKGMSLLDNLASLGGTGTPPAATPDLQGLQSFSLATATPEPSTIALGVIGASAFLFRRRK
jgi:hypothetical protein